MAWSRRTFFVTFNSPCWSGRGLCNPVPPPTSSLTHTDTCMHQAYGQYSTLCWTAVVTNCVGGLLYRFGTLWVLYKFGPLSFYFVPNYSTHSTVKVHLIINSADCKYFGYLCCMYFVEAIYGTSQNQLLACLWFIVPTPLSRTKSLIIPVYL